MSIIKKTFIKGIKTMSYHINYTNASITVSVSHELFGSRTLKIDLDITPNNFDVHAEIEVFLENLNIEHDLELEVSDTKVVNYENVPDILQCPNDSMNAFLDDETGDYIEALQNDPSIDDMLITALKNGFSVSNAVNSYIGFYDDDNMEAFGERMAENNPYLEEMPQNLRCHFDFKSYGETCLNDYTVINGYVFSY